MHEIILPIQSLNVTLWLTHLITFRNIAIFRIPAGGLISSSIYLTEEQTKKIDTELKLTCTLTMTWTHRPGWGPCYPECDLSLMFTSVRWLPITECPLQFMSHWPRPWQQGRFLDPLLQRFKSISTQYLMNKMSRRQKKSIYSWNLTPASDPWQQVMDDHDKWNPDMEETSTKITCLSGARTGSAASAYR